MEKVGQELNEPVAFLGRNHDPGYSPTGCFYCQGSPRFLDYIICRVEDIETFKKIKQAFPTGHTAVIEAGNITIRIFGCEQHFPRLPNLGTRILGAGNLLTNEMVKEAFADY